MYVFIPTISNTSEHAHSLVSVHLLLPDPFMHIKFMTAGPLTGQTGDPSPTSNGKSDSSPSFGMTTAAAVPHSAAIVPPHGGEVKVPPHGGEVKVPPHGGEVKVPPHGGEVKVPPHGGEVKVPPHGGEVKVPPHGGEVKVTVVLKAK